jgi:hypothetical protein
MTIRFCGTVDNIRRNEVSMCRDISVMRFLSVREGVCFQAILLKKAGNQGDKKFQIFSNYPCKLIFK